MKKKNLILAGIMIFTLCLMSQFANAQSCSGGEILMSKGCICAQRSFEKCQSKCVKSNQVLNLQKQGWYFGECSTDCCPTIKNGKNIIDTALLANINGRLVKTIADKFFQQGENKFVWTASDVTAGVYFLRLQSQENLKTEKLIVTK